MKDERKGPVLDPVEKWLRFKEKFNSHYNRHPFVKAFAEYTAEGGKEAYRYLHSQIYVKHLSSYSFQAKSFSGKLELLSPHNTPGTRLILGLCSHCRGRDIFKRSGRE